MTNFPVEIRKAVNALSRSTAHANEPTGVMEDKRRRQCREGAGRRAVDRQFAPHERRKAFTGRFPLTRHNLLQNASPTPHEFWTFSLQRRTLRAKILSQDGTCHLHAAKMTEMCATAK
jgi:hypothetical protein